MEESTVKYNFSYDSETNIVTIAAKATLSDGSVEINEISGVGFINDNDEIDAVMNIDGEGVLLSEMRRAGMIENCGWFSSLIKKIVKSVVVAAVTAVVVAATAAVVVATAGVAATALVAIGAGAAGSAAVVAGGAAVGVAAGALFYKTVGEAALEAGVAAGEVLGNAVESAIEQIENKVKAKIDELSKLKNYRGQHFIVRAGNCTNLNFTPKDKDFKSETDYGLSFFKDITALLVAMSNITKVCITTVELVEQTGYLYVINDHGDHMSVRPNLGVLAFKLWIKSRTTADTNPHEYTKLLKNTIIAVV